MPSVRAWIAVALLLVPAMGRAQIDVARRHLENADFSRALRAFDRAEAGGGLTRTDVVALYEGRAMARWALGEEDGARRDLLALGTLDPAHALPPEAPPDLRTAFEQMPRRALAVGVEFDDAPGRTTLRVALENDDAGIVREVITHVRRGEEPWTTDTTREIAISTEPGVGIMVWVEAIGPADAVVASEGTALAPIQHGRDGAAPPPTAATSDDTPLWVGLGIGAGIAAVVIIVLAAVFATARSDATQPSGPMVAW